MYGGVEAQSRVGLSVDIGRAEMMARRSRYAGASNSLVSIHCNVPPTEPKSVGFAGEMPYPRQALEKRRPLEDLLEMSYNVAAARGVLLTPGGAHEDDRVSFGRMK